MPGGGGGGGRREWNGGVWGGAGWRRIRRRREGKGGQALRNRTIEEKVIERKIKKDCEVNSYRCTIYY